MRIAVFVSGGGTNLQALIDAKDQGRLQEVSFELVVSSNESAYALTRAIKAGIPTAVLKRKVYSDIRAYDLALIDLLEPYKIDLIVFAGFLSKVGEQFISQYDNRIINIHPSLLPDFGGSGFYGIRPHEAVIQNKLKESGATVHLVTKEYDEGPILRQKRVPVLPEDTAKDLQERVMLDVEQVILTDVIEDISLGKIDLDKLSRSIQ